MLLQVDHLHHATYHAFMLLKRPQQLSKLFYTSFEKFGTPSPLKFYKRIDVSIIVISQGYELATYVLHFPSQQREAVLLKRVFAKTVPLRLVNGDFF